MRHSVNKRASVRRFGNKSRKTRRENLAVARGGFRL